MGGGAVGSGGYLGQKQQRAPWLGARTVCWGPEVSVLVRGWGSGCPLPAPHCPRKEEAMGSGEDGEGGGFEAEGRAQPVQHLGR